MGTIVVRRALRLNGLALLIVGALIALSATASAEVPDFVLRMPQSPGMSEPGSGASQTSNPRSIAANRSNGRVYVSDLFNNRIDEYTAWGLFVRSWGWNVAPEGMPGDTPTDELETCGPPTPEANPPVGLCQAGGAGQGKGQLDRPRGLAVDPSGNVYVFDSNNLRVQKFSAAGEFLLMFGGDVNQTKVGEGAGPEQRNLCPVDIGDICKAGVSGEEPSQLDPTIGDVIAYSPAPTDAIVVGDKNRIQIFNLNGTCREEIAFEGPLASFAGKQVNGLDVDKDRNIYFSLDGTEDLYKISPTGEPLAPGKPGSSSFKAEVPLGVAVDVQGSVYAIDDPSGDGEAPRVLKYGASGIKLLPTEAEEKSGEPFPERTQDARLTAIATNFCTGSEEPGSLYVGFFNEGALPHVSYVDAYGTGPVGCEDPPPNPPDILEQFATFVGREEATVRALINPRFFGDATYYVEYGTAPCAQGGCPNKAPLSSALLTDRQVNAPISTAGVILEGLAPATTYYYGIAAQSTVCGPVFGSDATFSTHNSETRQAACPNDPFRLGAGAKLPDCRAYEMVSPLDKGNADVALGIGRNNAVYRLFEVNQASLSGGRFTFTAATAFGDARSAPFASQYLAEREGTGWGSKAISPPRTDAGVATTLNFGSEFQGFTADLCRGWLRLYSVAPLTPDAVAKYPNLYRRDNCAESPSYTALTNKQPPNRTPEQYTSLLIKGFSTDGSHAIFAASDALHPDAPLIKGEVSLLYEQTSAGLRFVCYLPSGKPTSESCSAGVKAGAAVADLSSLKNAISADGSHIFWTAYSGAGISGSNPGRLFARIDGQETVAVSGAVAPEPAFFWTAAEDGSKAIFSFIEGIHKGELYEFDVDAQEARLIASGVEGSLGASEEASRLYFASSEDLDGAGPASVGAHNLYLYEADPNGGAGSFDFVMALPAVDVSPLGTGLSIPPVRPVSLLPAMRVARVTPDGLHATFMSAATPTPTGYDNRDAETGKAAIEVYRYDAMADELLCVSCNPTGARPAAGNAEGFLAAARIQGWEANHHAPRVISDDDSRVFFESHEALVPEDSNGTWDVYEWEEPGKGTCTTARDTYSDVTGGCVDLISSGQSPARSLFLDADPSGDNVFFGTQSSLVGSDYGLNDVYVARVGGGFPEPSPPSECEGAACQSPPPPPPLATPASEAFQGPGDKVKRKCPKGKRKVKRKGKVLCVKKRSHKRKAAQRKGSRR